MSEVHLILREAALILLEDPRIPGRLRNYEIEYRLEQALQGTWVVAEWCPFNGTSCAYFEHASLPDLSEALANNKAGGYPDHVIRKIEEQLNKKKAEKGAKLKQAFINIRMAKQGYLSGTYGDGI